jgi:hypothetical protein
MIEDHKFAWMFWRNVLPPSLGLPNWVHVDAEVTRTVKWVNYVGRVQVLW